MTAKLEINVAEAIEAYYNLRNYNKMLGITDPNDKRPSVIFLGKLRTFLIEKGVELK